MREVIQIHVGQAGCQIGNSCWELYCLEHGILHDGKLYQNDQNYIENDSFKTFFSDSTKGKYVPRAIFIDSDPTVIDEVRSGVQNELYNPEQLNSGIEDCSNNYACGRVSIGKMMLDQVLDSIRKLADDCSQLQGFIFFHSLGGGTGTGLGSLIMERIALDYGRKTKMEIGIFPAKNISVSVMEPYNSLLAAEAMKEHVDVGFMIDNQAMYNICHRNLEIEHCEYTNINKIIAQTVSSLTASLRFDGALNTSLDEIKTNLVPYKEIHFPICSCAPFVSLKYVQDKKPTVEDITAAVLEPRNMLVDCDIAKGQHMACCMMYRGDVTPKDVNAAIAALKSQKTLRFVDWCPTSFKTDINYQPLATIVNGDMANQQRSVLMLSNNTGICKIWTRIAKDFDLLQSQRAFIHWIVSEGMEESELSEARENIMNMEKNYQELETRNQEQNDV